MRIALFFALAALLSACAPPPLAPQQPRFVNQLDRSGEKALAAGIRSYENAEYFEAEEQLGVALLTGLASGKDRANAQKHLAFIYCTTSRATQCESAFRSAMLADPGFALSKSEAGHPLWGPVYKRLQP